MADEQRKPIRFVEDLPEQARGRARGASQYWLDIAEKLRQNPGTWALVQDDAPSSLASQIRKGTYAAFRPSEEFEAATRRDSAIHKMGRGALYIRYVGENAEHA